MTKLQKTVYLHAARALSLIMIFLQVFCPVYALAVEAYELPMVYITYIDRYGEEQTTSAWAMDYSGGPVYWVQLEDGATPVSYQVMNDNGEVEESGSLQNHYTTDSVDGNAAAWIQGCGLYLSNSASPSGNGGYDPEPYNPEPVAQSAWVTFRYVDTNGGYLDESSQELDNGWYSTGDYVRSFDGYTYQYCDSDSFSISDGYANPGAVTYYYQPNPTTASVTFRYVDTNGGYLDESSQELDNGWYSTGDYVRSFDGYTYQNCDSDSVTISDGNANPGTVTYYYQPNPTTASVTFRYVDTNGGYLDESTQELDNGWYSTGDYVRSFDGYTYQNCDSDSVTISDGNANPGTVTYYYQPNPTTASVTFRYADTNGGYLDESTQELDNGWYSTGDYIRSFDGYTYQNCDSDSVTISDGNANPGTVTYYYQPNPTTASVTFRYVDTNGGYLDESTQELDNGWYSTGDYVRSFDGYTYQNCDSDSFSISDGYANPGAVTYYYQPNPTTASVTFRYVDTNGGYLDESTQELDNGWYSTGDYVRIFDGYTYQSCDTDSVTISDGNANPGTVTYYYQPNPTAASVTFVYVDEMGSTLTSDTQEMSEGSYYTSAFVQSFEGYTFRQATAETFTVSGGKATPDTITYTYSKDPTSASVTFVYADEMGSTLASDTQEMSEGSYYTSAFVQSFEGYTFRQATAETFTVSGGKATPDTITYTYSKNPTAASVTFVYVDEMGSTLGSDTQEMSEGSYYTSAFVQSFEGYTFRQATAETFTVSGGKATPDTITYTYSKNPTAASVNFVYADEMGSRLAAETQEMNEGSYYTSAFVQSFEGYTFRQATADTFTVSGGKATPDTITYTYSKNPTTAQVTFHYQEEGTRATLAEDITATLNEGTTNTSEYVRALSGYTYRSSSSETVTVRDAKASPAAVTFYYSKDPEPSAKVVFKYLNESGKALVKASTVDLVSGTWNVLEFIQIIDGYTFDTVSTESVYVDAAGHASPAEVVFTYRQTKKTGALEVHYVNVWGEDFGISPEIRDLKAGTYTITPNPAYAPAGYTLSASTTSYTVTVDKNLTVKPNSVSFTYYSNTISGDVRIEYYDSSTGSLITTETRTMSPGSYTLQPDDALIGRYGNYERSSVVTDSRVEVKEDGTVLPSVIRFYYKPVSVDVYQGYLMTTRQTAMRSSAATNGGIVQNLSGNTLLWTAGQYTSGNIVWNSTQTVLGNSVSGWVNNADVRRVTTAEAQALVEEYNHRTSTPDQDPGYYITIMSNVPMRSYADPYAEVRTYLRVNQVVYVVNQVYGTDGYVWHTATYNGQTGYIRSGQIRKLSDSEVLRYISGSATTPAPTQYNPYNDQGESSYGYVTNGGVNFRASASTQSARIGTLNKYAMAMILDTQTVNGVRWFKVNYAGTTGWIHGNYFHQMTLSEFNSFIGSPEYYRGISNNSTDGNMENPGNTSSSSSGTKGQATQGHVSTVEDWNVDTWQNTGVTTATSYAPFNPYATATATPTPTPSSSLSPSTSPMATESGAVSSFAPLSQPTVASTFVIGTMIPIEYEDETKETQTNTVPWGLIGGGVVVIGGAAGAYFYMVNQNRKRRLAAEERARLRNQRGNGTAANGRAQTSGTGRPSGSTSGYNQPMTGTANQNSHTAGNPYAPRTPAGTTNQGTSPYRTGSSGTGDYSRFGGTSSTSGNPYSRPLGVNTQASGTSGSTQDTSSHSENGTDNTGNPYARPTVAAGNNPYARPASSDHSYSRPAGDNPYAPAASTTAADSYSYAPAAASAAAANPYAPTTAADNNPYAPTSTAASNPYAPTAAGSSYARPAEPANTSSDAAGTSSQNTAPVDSTTADGAPRRRRRTTQIDVNSTNNQTNDPS